MPLAACCQCSHFLIVAVVLLTAFSGCASTRTTFDLEYIPPPPSTAHAVHLKSFNSLGELVPRRGSWVEVFRGRPVSPYVSTPAGIAYRDNHLYICDTGLDTVHNWDLARGRAERIKLTGKDAPSHPVDVAVDELGMLYIADSERGEIIATDASGSSVRHFEPPNREAYKPVAVALHGDTLYAADIASHTVDVFATDTGSLTASIGVLGSKLGMFYYPMGVAADADGRVYVADMMNSRVQVFGPQQVFQMSMGQPGDRYGDMGKPKHLDVGPDGTIFIADSQFAHIHLFSQQGHLLMLLGGPESKIGSTPMPVGVAIAPSLPERLASLVPPDFDAHYYLFTTNTVGPNRINLFAIGLSR
ncbi:MAG: hypothetical protein JSU63_11395 [Phycisphaerales bacterium]|nr:MAG: hypothetical protein JSU63_11395 [Phycisphaerales bacterium]